MDMGKPRARGALADPSVLDMHCSYSAYEALSMSTLMAKDAYVDRRFGEARQDTSVVVEDLDTWDVAGSVQSV